MADNGKTTQKNTFTTDAAGEKDHSSVFDLDRLRLPHNFAETVGVKKALITVPVRKPGRQDFIRVHPDPNYRFETTLLELNGDHETYLVAPELRSELQGEAIPKALFTTINRQGVLTLWPIRLPGEDGRLDDWNASALEATEMAQKRWIRVASNRSLGAYEVYEARGNLPEPDWPAMEFLKILEIAFKDRYIDGLDHPVIRQLRGEF